VVSEKGESWVGRERSGKGEKGSVRSGSNPGTVPRWETALLLPLPSGRYKHAKMKLTSNRKSREVSTGERSGEEGFDVELGSSFFEREGEGGREEEVVGGEKRPRERSVQRGESWTILSLLSKRKSQKLARI